ncbi:hypothetical protein [Pyrodictium delaneyi]|uniref:Uncharacterized protein n=1 Tax=Pyrodictium delaneyi TaxID=1273541 RepID=A0A211YNT3_9CREN|nr:hypothetical protein [Pyrodictium delaneyi]OWJ54621.1 hypothetical protein Pdsh_06260 [Pyrodictium delaneyi]
MLSGYGDRSIAYGIVNAGPQGFKLIAMLEAEGCTRSIVLSVAESGIEAQFSRVHLPVDHLGNEDPRREPFTLVESYPSLLGRLLGASNSRVLLGYMLVCIESSQPFDFLVVGGLYDAGGRPAPLASTVLEPGTGTSYLRTTISTTSCAKSKCSGCAIIPLWLLEDIAPPGVYRLVLNLYIPGSDRPIAVYEHNVYIRLLSYGDIGVAAIVAGLGVLVLPLLARISDSKRLAYMALTGASLTALSRLIGGVVFRLSSVLGPFDWIVYGPITSGLYYGLLAACLAATGEPMVAAGAVLVEWLLSSLILGSGNLVLSAFWAFTTLFVVAAATYAARVTDLRLLPVYFAAAKALDSYVDINIYAYAYRLYYAGWYIAVYSAGMALYALLGSAAVTRMVSSRARS